MRALRQDRAFDPNKVIGTYDMLDAAQVLRPEEIEGVRVVAPRFATSAGQAANAEWIRSFREHHGKLPLYTHAFAYDMASIIDHVAQAQPRAANNAAWLTALRAIRMVGVTGELSFDQDGDLNTPLAIGIFRAGQVVLAPEERASR